MLRLSQRHGVNPSMQQCFICMKEFGIVLFGLMKGDKEAPKTVCLDTEPCDQCKELMTKGVILISVDEAKSEDRNNPWRTGGWVVIKDSFIKRAITDKKLAEQILSKRFAFVPDEAWDAIGLPRQNKP